MSFYEYNFENEFLSGSYTNVINGKANMLHELVFITEFNRFQIDDYRSQLEDLIIEGEKELSKLGTQARLHIYDCNESKIYESETVINF